MLTIFVKDLMRFVRVETGLFITGMAASGYLISSGLDYSIITPLLAAFLLSCLGYAYNHMTDRDEDAVNDSGLNPLSENRYGKMITVGLLMACIAMIPMLKPVPAMLYLLSILAIISYSLFRLKKVFLLKNIYTGLFMALAFAIGALSGRPGPDTPSYFIFVFFMGFAVNLLGDIRGTEGDRKAGVKTIPVVFGVETAKTVMYATVLSVLMAVSSSGFTLLLFFSPFLTLMLIFLQQGQHRAARFSMLSSFPLFPVFLAVKMGVV